MLSWLSNSHLGEEMECEANRKSLLLLRGEKIRVFTSFSAAPSVLQCQHEFSRLFTGRQNTCSILFIFLHWWEHATANYTISPVLKLKVVLLSTLLKSKTSVSNLPLLNSTVKYMNTLVHFLTSFTSVTVTNL